MRKHWTLFLLGGCFLAVIASNAILAWDGNNISLITLAVVSVMATAGMVGFGYGWRAALDGWGKSTQGWAAAQTWGITQDQILHDVLKELYEYDEEAVEIHNGRSAVASLEYIKTFQEDGDADAVSEVTTILEDSMKRGMR